MTALVLDCSIAAAWLFADEADPATDHLLARIKEALNESILDSSEHARRKCDFHLASKSVTYVTDFGGTSLCRAEALIQSELP